MSELNNNQQNANQEMDNQSYNNSGFNQNFNTDQGFDPNYEQQTEGQSQPPKQTNTLVVVGLVLGIVSIVAGCCGWVAFLTGIPGLVCSILSRKQGKTGMSVAGIICSAIGILIGVVMTIMGVAVMMLIGGTAY